MKHREYPPLGTVSHGTMRSEDLIPDFMDVLDEYAPELARKIRHENADVFSWLQDTEQKEPEFLSEFINELFDELHNIAAPYTYFGATEGDASDYGFWPAIDSMENDARCGDLVKINAGDPWPKVVGLIMAVTDHGNVTLYERKRNGHVSKVWSCV